ncbi:cyclodeaminase/cyclohydrolase family protein [Clostridiaceae bacterium OttesenSCG-928-D20]|nr:cyclodeaminase/cyclohydrolase family protein [Clostridiaceae bacterium OttesenSCG-928-D20]
MSLLENNLSEFTALLESKSAVPGGGGASALVAAIGISLGTMVGNLTVGKKKYADVEDDIKILMQKSERLRLELLELIDGDALAFEPLSKAYAISKDDPSRDSIMEDCLKTAAGVPMQIARLSSGAIELQKAYAEMGSKIAISDAGTGVSFCLAALNGAALNVKINTALMKDRKFAEELEAELSKLLGKYRKMADEVYSLVEGRIS